MLKLQLLSIVINIIGTGLFFLLGILCSLCIINHSTNMEEGILKIKVLKLGGFPSTGSSITQNKINILTISLLLSAPVIAIICQQIVLVFQRF